MCESNPSKNASLIGGFTHNDEQFLYSILFLFFTFQSVATHKFLFLFSTSVVIVR